MNLIVSCATLSSGGAERVLSLLSYHFVQNYDKVTFVLWKHADIFYDLDQNVNIIDIEQLLHTTNEFRKILWFRSFIKQHRDSILLSFLYPYNIRVLIATLGIKTKIIIAERRDGRKVKGGMLVRNFRNLLYTRATKIVLQTNSNITNYPKFLRKKITVIPNPIKILKSAVGVALNTYKEDSIVSVGRLIDEKNHIFLIRVFKKLLAYHPSYSLKIYGEGPIRPILEHEITRLGIEHKVLLLGNVRNIDSYISSAKIFVLPSKSEGMPNALFEAMVLGLPCISTKVNGAIDYIQDGINGLLVESNNEEQLLDSMLKLIQNKRLAVDISTISTEIYSLLNQQSINDKWINTLNN